MFYEVLWEALARVSSGGHIHKLLENGAFKADFAENHFTLFLFRRAEVFWELICLVFTSERFVFRDAFVTGHVELIDIEHGATGVLVDEVHKLGEPVHWALNGT